MASAIGEPSAEALCLSSRFSTNRNNEAAGEKGFNVE